MWRNASILAVVATVCGGGGYLAGRKLGPERVEVRVEDRIVERVVTKEVVKWRERQERKLDQHREIVKVQRPDGTVETRTVTDTHAAEVKVAAKEATTDSVKEATRTHQEARLETRAPRWMVGAAASLALDLEHPGLSPGVEAKVRVLGPVWAGVQVFPVEGRGIVSLAVTL